MKFKPYFRQKGRFVDGRKRVIIEWAVDRWGNKQSKALPKPEVLLKMMDTKTIPKITSKNDN